MLAEVERPLKFINEIQRTSKKGNLYQQIIIGDPVAYQQYVFFRRDDLILTNVQPGDDVTITLELNMRGYNLNTDLVAVKKYKQTSATS